MNAAPLIHLKTDITRDQRGSGWITSPPLRVMYDFKVSSFTPRATARTLPSPIKAKKTCLPGAPRDGNGF